MNKVLIHGIKISFETSIFVSFVDHYHGFSIPHYQQFLLRLFKLHLRMQVRTDDTNQSDLKV